MLQGFIFTQKRHLEYNFLKFPRKSAFRLGHCAHRVFALPSLQPQTAINCAGGHQRPHPQSADMTSWTIDATPFPELAPIINVLSWNESPDNIAQCVKGSPSLLSLFGDRKKMRDVAVCLAQSMTPHRSIDVLELAYNVGHTLTHGTYEAVSFHLASRKHWKLVLVSASLGIKHAGGATVRLLNWRARALLELQQYGHVQNVLNHFDNARILPTSRTYQIVLIGCLRNHDMEGAKHCIRRMRETGNQSYQTLSLIGRFHRNFGVDREILQNDLDNLSNLSPNAAVLVLNSIVQSALDVKDVFTALNTLNLFEKSYVEDITPTLKTPCDIPVRIIPEVYFPRILDGLLPDTRTFAIIMNYHIRCTNYQRAVDLGRGALAKGLPATEDIVTSFVHALFLQNNGNAAIAMIARISNTPMPVEFGALMARRAPRVDQDTIPDILNVPLTIRICNALIRGIVRRQGLRHMPRIFAIMHANNIQPNARTLEILISHMSSSERVRPRTILKILQDLSSTTLVTVRHFHHIIRYVLREEKRLQFGSGWGSYAKRSQSSSRTPRMSLGNDDPLDPLSGITFGTHTGYGTIAKSLLQSFVEREVKSDPAMICMRIRRDILLHGEIDAAKDIFRTLSARGMHASHHHFSALMEGYSIMGDLNATKEVMKLARNAGCIPNVVMYTILIHGFGRKHDPLSALNAFSEMLDQGIYPDVASIDAVVGAFFASGASRMARKHLIMLWPYIEPFPESLRNASLMTLISRFRSLEVSRSKLKRTSHAKASIYHQLRRLLAAYRRYFTAPKVWNVK